MAERRPANDSPLRWHEPAFARRGRESVMSVGAKLQDVMGPQASEVSVEGDSEQVVLPDESSMLTQRVRRTVGMIQVMFRTAQRMSRSFLVGDVPTLLAG